MPIYKADITGGKCFGTMNPHSFKNLLLMQYSMFMLAIYAIFIVLCNRHAFWI